MDSTKLRMTPGPTELPPEVLKAMSRPIPNPDVEPEFTAFYRRLLGKLGTVYGTDDDLLVLAGEGMLGLEASVASVVDPGESVLCLANGVFGAGFADLVELHGGEAVVHETSDRTGFDVGTVESLLEDSEFAAATMVHCETPTGLLNDLDEILAACRDAGVLTIVDAVSSLGGTPVPVEQIDVCLGASQKCFSSPPGLSTLSVSDRAWEAVEATEQSSFYTSLEPWHGIDLDTDEAVLQPYTPSVSNLAALDASLDRLLDEGVDAVHERHAAVAEYCRERGRDLGLEPYPDSRASWSPTVTAFEVPGRAETLQRRLAEEHDVVVATGLGDHADDVLRIGHMGYNAERDRVERTMDALATVLE
ncbi:alanine--glyoxylate aminotransferase family protein [Haloarculaceae archaeon H-GB2-1]|nr:alanine--glyoxylate aminotransferase family protein [Haloarculaceae archaeon H-GB1-1]MEA5409833.1 alanine--glyoxylate aminotransferase family protein [Haloarculaceae archaeon H-GB2-1]